MDAGGKFMIEYAGRRGRHYITNVIRGGIIYWESGEKKGEKISKSEVGSAGY